VDQRDDRPVPVETGGEAFTRGRLEVAAPDVVFARPHHLDRRADGLREFRGFGGVVREQPAPESAAHHHAVQSNRHLRQTGDVGDLFQRSHIGLGRRPHLSAIGAHVRRAIHRLHRCVSLEREDVYCFVLSGRRCQSRHRIAVVPHLEGRAIEGLRQRLQVLIRVEPAVSPVCPFHLQRAASLECGPRVGRNHRNAWMNTFRNRDDVSYAWYLEDLVAIES
jgi:hypothetical protein